MSHGFSGDNGNGCDYCGVEWEDRFLVACKSSGLAKGLSRHYGSAERPRKDPLSANEGGAP